MDLRSIHLSDLMPCITQVERKMDGPKSCTRLLNAARADTPIIGEILQAMSMIHAEKHSAQKRRGFDNASRHVTLFLALRELERTAARKKTVKRGASDRRIA